MIGLCPSCVCPSVNFFFKQHLLLNHWSEFHIALHVFPMMLFQNCINGSAPPNRRAARATDKKSFKRHLLLNHWPKFKMHRIVLHNILYQNCTNGNTLLNKRAARAPDKKYLKRHFLLNNWSKFKIISQNCSSRCLLPKLHKWFQSAEQRGCQSSRNEMSLKYISSWTTDPNSK